MSEIRFIRRNRVDERLATAIAIASGLVALLSPASPTGSAVPDVLVVFAAVASVSWASASAPWWMLGAAAGVAGAIALSPIALVAGFLAFLAALHIGLFRRDDSEVRAVIGGVLANVFAWSALEGFFGLSAIISVSVCSAVVVSGVLRRPSKTRRGAWIGAGAVGALAVLAIAGLAAAGTGARTDLTDAASSARSAVRLLNDGDYQAAAVEFDAAADGFDRASGQLDGPLAFPARLLPGVAQNLTAGRELASVATDATSDAAAALREVDPKLLTLRNGSIDLDAVRAVEAPLARVENALIALDAASERVRSDWLISPLRRQLDSLQADLDDNRPKLATAREAVRLAPQLLGGDGERRYLLLFTTPGESRGATGFFGNWAEMTVTDGLIEIVEFGRTGQLNVALRANGSSCDGCSAEFLTYYGQYGFTTGDDGSVGNVAWSNITIPAHFPYAAEAVASIYPGSGGRVIDGVIAMDPYTIAELMAITGPIEVAELDVIVSSAEAAEFLLVDQYALADEQSVRVEALETLAAEAITRLLTSSLPDPPEIARDFGPLVEEGRLLMWTTEPVERAFLNEIGMLGALPALDPVDGGFGFTVINGSANKIDSFLEREVEIEEVFDEQGSRALLATVTLTNTAPTDGFPSYIIGNAVGLPVGTSRLIVTLFGPAGAEALVVDGESVPVATGTEAGWFGYRTTVEIGSGRSVELSITLPLPGDDVGEFEPVVWTQPLRRT